MNRRPRLTIHAPNASAEETAAIVAALERFMRANAPPPGFRSPQHDRWQRAALHEGVARRPSLPALWE